MMTPNSATTRTSSLQVLLVEDSRVHQQLAMGLLERMGHVVTVVGNGEEAVEAFARHHYDLVLMDVEMPVLDGLRATRAIREQERARGTHVPIVAVSSTEDCNRCFEAGMDGFLAKPLDADALDSLLQRLGAAA